MRCPSIPSAPSLMPAQNSLRPWQLLRQLFAERIPEPLYTIAFQTSPNHPKPSQRLWDGVGASVSCPSAPCVYLTTAWLMVWVPGFRSSWARREYRAMTHGCAGSSGLGGPTASPLQIHRRHCSEKAWKPRFHLCLLLHIVTTTEGRCKYFQLNV